MPIFLIVMILEALIIICTMYVILLFDYVFLLASLNIEDPSTERQAFFSLSKCIEDINHQCKYVIICKLRKESCSMIQNLTMFV